MKIIVDVKLGAVGYPYWSFNDAVKIEETETDIKVYRPGFPHTPTYISKKDIINHITLNITVR